MYTNCQSPNFHPACFSGFPFEIFIVSFQYSSLHYPYIRSIFRLPSYCFQAFHFHAECLTFFRCLYPLFFFLSPVYIFSALAPSVPFSHLSIHLFYYDNVSCKVAFARGHRETAENLCRHSWSFPLRLDLCNRYFDYEHQPSEFNLPLNASMRQLAHG